MALYTKMAFLMGQRLWGHILDSGGSKVWTRMQFSERTHMCIADGWERTVLFLRKYETNVSSLLEISLVPI